MAAYRTKKGPWIRLYVGWWTDARVLSVSREAELIWLRSIAWSKDNRLDGEIPEYALLYLMPKITSPPSAIAHELVTAGLWLPTDTGWCIPPDKWAYYQITREETEKARVQKANGRAKKKTGTDGHQEP